MNRGTERSKPSLFVVPHSHPAPTRRVVVLPPVERLVPDLAEALPVSQAKFEDLGVAEGAEKGEEEGEFCREGLWGGGGEGAHARLVEPAAEVKGREGGEGGLEEGDQGRVSRLGEEVLHEGAPSNSSVERWRMVTFGRRRSESAGGTMKAPWTGREEFEEGSAGDDGEDPGDVDGYHGIGKLEEVGKSSENEFLDRERWRFRGFTHTRSDQVIDFAPSWSVPPDLNLFDRSQAWYEQNERLVVGRFVFDFVFDFEALAHPKHPRRDRDDRTDDSSRENVGPGKLASAQTLSDDEGLDGTVEGTERVYGWVGHGAEEVETVEDDTIESFHLPKADPKREGKDILRFEIGVVAIDVSAEMNTGEGGELDEDRGGEVVDDLEVVRILIEVKKGPGVPVPGVEPGLRQIIDRDGVAKGLDALGVPVSLSQKDVEEGELRLGRLGEEDRSPNDRRDEASEVATGEAEVPCLSPSVRRDGIGDLLEELVRGERRVGPFEEEC